MKGTPSSSKNHLRAARGFTLIELLVVVAIIAVLVSMLLPALSTARESAKKVACGSNMSQVARAFRFYASDNSDWLPIFQDNLSGTDGLAATFGNWVGSNNGLAALVTRPSSLSASDQVAYFYAKGNTGYLPNADALFCPSDTVRASLRQKNPTDTHGWAPYYTISQQYYSRIDYNSAGFWYLFVPEDEAASGKRTAAEYPLFVGMKRYKVDTEDASRKFVLMDIGHSPLVPTGPDFYLTAHEGWNVLYADGHVTFHQLQNVNAFMETRGVYDIRGEFEYFDQHN